MQIRGAYHAHQSSDELRLEAYGRHDTSSIGEQSNTTMQLVNSIDIGGQP